MWQTNPKYDADVVLVSFGLLIFALELYALWVFVAGLH